MLCSKVRDQLPLFVYGDLKPGEAAVVESHLTTCSDCQGKVASLRRLRERLNLPPVPAMSVDMTALHQQAGDLQAKHARRWRRLAVTLGSAAALLLIALAVRFEVRLDNHQLVLRWGSPPPEAPRPAASVPDLAPVLVRHSPATEEQLRLLSDLIHALKKDVDARDRDQQREIAILQARLQALQIQANQRWIETDRNVEALYLLANRGGNP